MRLHGRPVPGFWIGCRVLKRFNGQPFRGIIDDIDQDDGQTYLHVSFEDFDEAEFDMGEVWDHAIYHPDLDVDGVPVLGTNMPEVGSVVLFSFEQRPRIGRVVEIREHDPKPIVVHLWKPKRNAQNFVSAMFLPFCKDGEPSLLSVTAPRIRCADLEVDEKGYFLPNSRKRLTKELSAWKEV